MRSPNGRVARDMMRSALELQRVVDEKGKVFEAASITSGALLLPLDTVTALVAPAQEQAIASGVALQGLGKSLAGMSGALSAIPVIGKVVQTFVKKTARRTLEPAGEKLRNNGIRIGKLEKNLEKTGSKVSMIDGLFLASAGVLVSVAAFFYSAGDILVKAHMCAFELGEEQVVAELEATMEAMRNGSQVLIRHLNNIPSNVTNPFGDLKLRLDILSVKLPNLLSEFTKINLALQPFMWLTKFMDFRMCFYFLFFEKCFTVGHMLNILGKLFGVLSFLVNPIADLFAGLFPDISLPLPSLLDSWLLDLDKIMLDIDIAYNTLLPAMQFPFDFTDLMLPDILAKLPDNLPCNPFDDDAEIEAEESLEDNEDDDDDDAEGEEKRRSLLFRDRVRLPLRITRRLCAKFETLSPRRRAVIQVAEKTSRDSIRRQLGGKLGGIVSTVKDRGSQQAGQHRKALKRARVSVRIRKEVPRSALLPVPKRADSYGVSIGVSNTVVEVVSGGRPRAKKNKRIQLSKILHLLVFYVRRANKKTGKDLQSTPFACVVDFNDAGEPSRTGEVVLTLDGDRNYYSDPSFVFMVYARLGVNGAKYKKLRGGDCALCPRKSRCIKNPFADIVHRSKQLHGGRDLQGLTSADDCTSTVIKELEGFHSLLTVAHPIVESLYKEQREKLEEEIEKFLENDRDAADGDPGITDYTSGMIDGAITLFNSIWGEYADAGNEVLDKKVAGPPSLAAVDALLKTWKIDSNFPMDFADFHIFSLFPVRGEKDEVSTNPLEELYFRPDTFGACALRAVYKDLFEISGEDLDEDAYDNDEVLEELNLGKVMQLLCEDEVWRLAKFTPCFKYDEKRRTTIIAHLETSLRRSDRTNARKLSMDRFGAFLNGFPSHQMKGTNQLYFPGCDERDCPVVEAKENKALPECVDQPFMKSVSRVKLMSEGECRATYKEKIAMSTRLCTSDPTLKDMKTLTDHCTLIRCFTPTITGETNNNPNKGYYKVGKPYWRSGVGKTKTGWFVKNLRSKPSDEVDARATQKYHVEHIVDHSEGGQNAFMNFIMTWGLPNLLLARSDKGNNSPRFEGIETQWQQIYAEFFKKTEELQDFCEKSVTTMDVDVTMTGGRNEDEEDEVEGGKKLFGKPPIFKKVIPRQEGTEAVVGYEGNGEEVLRLDLKKLRGNLLERKEKKREGEKGQRWWDYMKSLLDDLCPEPFHSGT